MTKTVNLSASAEAVSKKSWQRVPVGGEQHCRFGMLSGLVVLLLFLSGVLGKSNILVPACI